MILPSTRAWRRAVTAGIVAAVMLAASSLALGAGVGGAEHAHPPSPLLLAEAAACALALAAIAALSLAEAALVACSPHLMRRLSDAGDPRARMVQALFDDLGEDAITWLVVANNACILLVATLVGHLTVATVGPEHYTETALGALVFILAVCEVTPKTYASHHADRISLRVVRWVAPLARSWPARAALALIKAASWPVRRVLRVDSMHRHLRVTDEVLMSLADVAEEQAVLDSTQAQMFESIVEFANQTVREIMVPRVDIVSVDADASLSEIVEVIRSEGKSRIAVSQGADDPAVGMVYANDVLACLHRGELDRRARDLARDVHMVPDTKPVDELFREMRDRHIHIALVIDEHGSVDGLVSMEDVLEEIVGDMQDEHDTEEEPLVQALADDSYLVQGGATRSDLLDALGVTLSEDDGEFDTLGGFLFQCADEIPEPGFRTEYAGFTFEVAEMDGTRITRVRVRRLEPPDDAARTARQQGEER